MEGFGGVRRVFRLGAWRRELDDELAFHHEATVEELIASGMPKQEAEAEARRRFGSVRSYRRELEKIDRQAAWGHRWEQRWDVMRSSVGYAFRRLGRAPLFTAGVIVTFALGIGANATMFSILDRILLSPPAHIEEPDGMRQLMVARFSTFSWSSSGGVTSGSRDTINYLTYPDFVEFAKLPAFSGVAAVSSIRIALGHGAEATQAAAHQVTGNYFALLGVRPALGRFFGSDEDRFGGPALAVIGHGFWQSRYGGDPSVIGQILDFGYGPYTIVGVAPRGFTGADLPPVDVWLPLHVSAVARRDGDRGCFETRACTWLTAVGRIAPGSSAAQAEAQMTSRLQAALDEDPPPAGRPDPDPQAVLAPLMTARGPLAGPESRVAVWLAGISLIVLLIACANIANLIVARLAQHRREAAVRLALGSSRSRLIGQVILESVLLATFGGIAAILITRSAGSALRAFLLPDLAWDVPGMELRVAAVALLLAMMAGLLAGVVPSIQALRSSIGEVLKSGGRTISPPGALARRVLTALQAALCVVLLVGAGLFVRSLDRVGALDLGIDPHGVLLVNLTFSAGTTTAEQSDIYRTALERLRHLPAVGAISRDISIPFNATIMWGAEGVDGDSLPSSVRPIAHTVDPDYFRVMDLELRRGRGFGPADAAGSPVVVISESIARLLWPGEEAVGQCLIVGNRQEGAGCAEIIGVVENANQFGLVEERPVHFYIPFEQQRTENANGLLLRVNGDPAPLLQLIPRELAALDPRIRYTRVTPLEEFLDARTRSWRLGASLFTIFGLLALIVAGVGLYSALAYNVAQRTFEFGIRSALGARRRQILAAVLRNGLALAGSGIAVGLSAAYLLAPRLESLLFQVPARDPLTMVTVTVVLIAVAVVAALIPALRATRVDPAVALRSE